MYSPGKIIDKQKKKHGQSRLVYGGRWPIE